LFFGLEIPTLVLGMVIFLARVTDVTAGTVRTISIVQGRMVAAFFLAILEVGLWLTIITTVLDSIIERPVLGVFYACGFASGNIVGIWLERRLALGNLILRIISCRFGAKMADSIRQAGFGVTVFSGEGLNGPVQELFIVCRRKDLKRILDLAKSVDPDAFCITEQAGQVSKACGQFLPPPTGWRAVFKKK
jgi:uncharacterized protein YebE (UPF0316 family)